MANIWSLAKLSPVNGSDISLWLNLGNNVIRGRERKERKGGRERRGRGREREKRERERKINFDRSDLKLSNFGHDWI